MAKSRRFIIAGDNHGDVVDTEVTSSLFKFMEDFDPEVIIHTGDNYDFRNLRKGASDHDRDASLALDREEGNKFFRRYFAFGDERHFLRGNHDERLWTAAETAKGLIRDYAIDGTREIVSLCSRHKVSMLPYDSRLGVLDVGKLRVIHGYAHGMNAASKHARVYRRCFFGHTHAQDSFPAECVDDGDMPAEAAGVGCLCKRDMPYNAGQLNKLRHAPGWAYGWIYPDGSYTAFVARRINGKFHLPSDAKAY